MVGNAVTMSNHRFLVKCCSNMTVKGACTLGGRQLQHVCKLSLSGVCTESRRPPMSANCSVELLKQLCSPWESFIQAVLQFLQEKITNILQWTNPKTCVHHQDFAAINGFPRTHWASSSEIQQAACRVPYPYSIVVLCCVIMHRNRIRFSPHCSWVGLRRVGAVRQIQECPCCNVWQK